MGLVGIHSCWAAQVSFYRVYAFWSVTPHWEILILERINYKLRYSIYKDQTLFLNRWMIRFFISWFHFSRWYQIYSADGNTPWIRIICKFYRNTFSWTRNRLCLQIIETRMRMRSQQRSNWDAINTQKSRLCAPYT